MCIATNSIILCGHTFSVCGGSLLAELNGPHAVAKLYECTFQLPYYMWDAGCGIEPNLHALLGFHAIISTNKLPPHAELALYTCRRFLRMWKLNGRCAVAKLHFLASIATVTDCILILMVDVHVGYNIIIIATIIIGIYVCIGDASLMAQPP